MIEPSLSIENSLPETNTMSLLYLDNIQQIQQHRETWDRVAGAFPFHRWAWLGNWFEHLAADTKPAVLVAERDGKWHGIAPLLIDQTARDNRLRFWGSGKACTDYTGLICKPEISDQFALMVVDWLTTETASGGKLAEVDLIDLEGLTRDRDVDKMFAKVFEANGFDAHLSELEGCWVTELPASWEEFNGRLSKSMRRKTKKAAQRVQEESCVVESSSNVEFESLWPDFVALHQRRREMLGEAGCFADADFERFLKAASRELIEEKRGELIVINHDGRPLGAALLFNDVSTNYMYQSGADCQRMKQEPGYQVVLTAIKNSIENGFQHFDFLRGDEPYKSRWNTRRETMLRARFVPRKLRAQFKHNLWLTGQLIKQYLRPTP